MTDNCATELKRRESPFGELAAMAEDLRSRLRATSDAVEQKRSELVGARPPAMEGQGLCGIEGEPSPHATRIRQALEEGLRLQEQIRDDVSEM